MDGKVFVIGRDSIPARTVLSEGESLQWTFVALPGTSCEMTVEIDATAPGCSIDLAGLYICKGEDRLKLRVLLRHECGDCTSRQLFKGIVGDSAKALFDGLIYVAPNAVRTEAIQENHSLLLNQGASAESRPQLEIYADDVVCSHGATTGFLDENELFYMRSRGIPEQQARHLQMVAFLAPVASRLDETLSAEVYAQLS